jgi:DNA-binding IclR family transcriptional regulator
LARVHSQHLAAECEETRLGYASLAVPVYGSSGTLAGALSITAPTSRMNVAKMSGLLRTAGLGVSRTLRLAG